MAAIEKVLIVGGGIGGLSAAIALSRAGIRVEVAEIQREWQIYQVGIVVQANFIRAMAALGIADQAVAAGFPYDGLVFEDLHGHVLQRLRGAKLAGPNYPANLGMTRPALHEVLFNAARTAGATIRVGTTFRHVRQQADCVQVDFNDGSVGKYDLVIGADGIYSQLRSQLFGTQLPTAVHRPGYVALQRAASTGGELFIFLHGRGLPFGKCGFIPLTRETGYVWLVQSEPGNPRHSADRLADIFRDRLKGCTGIMGAMRDQITDSSRVVYRPLEALLLPPPWYRGRILLIGDAAHATTPHLGQGSAQAVEDAVVLGELLARPAPLQELLEEFMQRRFERCRFIVESSLQLGEWEQPPVPTADPVGLTARMLETVAAPI